ncbi:MAG: sugar transferase [Verrucomicrobia bacterium]|nr:sugar transferase [Verrucomicrobiota bacterium]
MKSLLVCPAERPCLKYLAEAVPLVNLSFCGKLLIFYWIEFLAAKGAKHISVLATDRPQLVRELVGDGSRWGICIDVLPERCELSLTGAEQKYGAEPTEFLPAPYHVNLADHLPELPDVLLFSSYAEFFRAAKEFILHAATPDRIGLREIKPGIWAGLHTKIPSTIKITAPCWIGDCVSLGENVELGPGAIIESRTVIDDGATITNSSIASETFIGPGTEITDSIVIQNNLINWKHGSAIQITDPFLLAPLHETIDESIHPSLWGRLAALLCLIATAPLAFVWILVSNLRGQTVLREMRAVNPYSNENTSGPTYYEFANCSGLWQRWPQLWNVVLGEFCCVGNRPLNTIEAETLTSEFEKLWLKAPIGLVSQADAEGCFEKCCDEARAHASFYTVHRSARRDLQILGKVIVGCGRRNVTANSPIASRVLEQEEIPLNKTAAR